MTAILAPAHPSGVFRIVTGVDFTQSCPYWVEPMGGLVSIRDQVHIDVAATEIVKRNLAILMWTEETFGKIPNDEYDNGVWGSFSGKYFFKDEEDRTMFVLRWS